jgi:hypothetical protein
LSFPSFPGTLSLCFLASTMLHDRMLSGVVSRTETVTFSLRLPDRFSWSSGCTPGL